MRIVPNAGVSTPAARRAGRSGSAGGDGFARALDAQPQASAQSVSSTSLVGGLLAFQEVEDPTSGYRKRAWKRGADLLDRLDELKLGILDGTISRGRLLQLSQLARESRAGTGDPGLDDVLGEIELRAAVELAKLHRETESLS